MKVAESAPQPSGRTAAMRKPKAPEANRARIVQAAIAEFAARGFKGASMDAIAARTHTTRAMINYYFGSKDKIYLAVLEHVYSEIRHAESLLDLEHLAPVEAMRQIVEFSFDYYLSHQYFVRIVVAENQAKGRHQEVEGHADAEPADSRPAEPRHCARPGRGDLPRRRRPLDVHMAIAALGNFNVTHQHTFSAIFQRDMGADGDVARRCAVVTDMILGYLLDHGRHLS